MSNTFTKTSLRGFTLIELLVVIAIIGLLSTAIMGPVQTGLKKGRDTRKISDISNVQGALLQYAGDNAGLYPADFGKLVPTYMALDQNMLGSAVARNKFNYVTFKDIPGNIISYHLGVSLENQNASLQGDVDCGDYGVTGTGDIDETKYAGGTAVNASSTACTAGMDNGSIVNTNFFAAGSGNPAATASSTDFGGSGVDEAANGVCTSKLTSCIFDVVPK